jgi:hypothetical protein
MNNILNDNKTNLTDPNTIKNITANGPKDLKDAADKGQKDFEDCWNKINDTDDYERSIKKYKQFF